jgi:acetylglutamate kinase
MTRVIKIGGNELNAPGFVEELARRVAALAGHGAAERIPLVLVHGGGQDIALLQERLHLPVVKVEGLRVTDAESLYVAQMVLSGHTNKLLVKALLAAGIDAIGLSGIDGGLLRCRKKEHPAADLGFVGEIVEVRAGLLRGLLQLGLLPVISPISLGLDGLTYNVNADEAAGAIALALRADALDFVSNVPGVLDTRGDPPARLPALSAAEAEALIADGVISGGMIPKVRTALDAVGRGIPQARIVDLGGLSDGGTVFH